MKSMVIKAALAAVLVALVAWLAACSKKSDSTEGAVDLSFAHMPHDSLQLHMALLAPVVTRRISGFEWW